MIKLFDRETQAFVGHFFRAYPGRTAVMIGLLIMGGLAEGVGVLTLLPLLEISMLPTSEPSPITQALVNGLAVVGIAPSLGVLLLLVVVMISLRSLFVWLAGRQVGYTVAQVGTDLRLRLIRAVLQARWRFFLEQPPGYFANSISTESARASAGYRNACEAIAGLVRILVYLGMVFVLSWQVAVAALIVGPVVAYGLKGFVAMSRRAGRAQTRLMRELTGRVTELLPGMKAIKAMGREASVLPLLENETEDFNSAQKWAIIAYESRSAVQGPIVAVFLAVGLFGIVTFGGAPTAAVLVAAALFQRVMTAANGIQSSYQRVTDSESAFSSLMTTLNKTIAAAEVQTGAKVVAPLLEQGIEIDDVWFSYEHTPVLRGASLRIAAGELVTLVGGSGAGKTTLVDLITGLLEPESGRVAIDGVPIREIDLSEWRSRIGYVPQEMLLFHDTIVRNVTLGAEGLGRDDVEWALRASGAWDFVAAHPDGLDRVVGERGGQLSGGQRQRIGLARAIVSHPRLLVLDEATTGLDPETERQICDNLVALRGQTTIIAISHQPAIQEVSDRVYQVAEGKTVLIERALPMRPGSSRESHGSPSHA